MSKVVSWLESPAGQLWAASHFSSDPSDCHDMIEVIDDSATVFIDDHTSWSSAEMLDQLKEYAPEWSDLTWTPDQDPTRV